MSTIDIEMLSEAPDLKDLWHAAVNPNDFKQQKSVTVFPKAFGARVMCTIRDIRDYVMSHLRSAKAAARRKVESFAVRHPLMTEMAAATAIFTFYFTVTFTICMVVMVSVLSFLDWIGLF